MGAASSQRPPGPAHRSPAGPGEPPPLRAAAALPVTRSGRGGRSGRFQVPVPLGPAGRAGRNQHRRTAPLGSTVCPSKAVAMGTPPAPWAGERLLHLWKGLESRSVRSAGSGIGNRALNPPITGGYLNHLPAAGRALDGAHAEHARSGRGGSLSPLPGTRGDARMLRAPSGAAVGTQPRRTHSLGRPCPAPSSGATHRSRGWFS